MCEPGRRCDRSSCPCNEPDTDLKDALTRMQERFPAPWKVNVKDISRADDAFIAMAAMGADDVLIQMIGPTPHAAVDAAIKAWDAAVKADALYALLGKACPEQLAALNVVADGYEACRAHAAVLKAECEAERVLRLNENTHSDWQTYEECRQAYLAARAATDKAGALR